jgi:putative tryptophan/tyrosine transport system substrate-binding protein
VRLASARMNRRRRDLVCGSWALLGTPGLALAQQARVPGKIGYLNATSIAPDHPTLRALRPAWHRLGYVEGETVLLRSADGDVSRVPALVAELLGQGAGVLIVAGVAAVKAASQTTRSTPIVAIDLVTDPVRAGYAASFNRPGGNVTGLFMDLPSLAGKWVDLLCEAAPDIQRLAIVWERSTGLDQLNVAMAAARAKGLNPVVLELEAIKNVDETLRGLRGKPRTGIVVLNSPAYIVVNAMFAAAARKHRLPTMGSLKAHARGGLLMSYGPVQEDYFPRAVSFADRILRGAKPGELPIEGPDRFEFVLNRRTAKAMGLALPTPLLLRVDEVIE